MTFQRCHLRFSHICSGKPCVHTHPWVCVAWVCARVFVQHNSHNNRINIDKVAVLLRAPCQPASVSHPAISADSEAPPAALICRNAAAAHKLGAESTRSLDHGVASAASSHLAATLELAPHT